MSVTFRGVGLESTKYCAERCHQCEQCDEASLDPEVCFNISNANAVGLGQLLGVDSLDENGGEWRAHALKATILRLLQGSLPDEGQPSVTEGRVVYGGRRAGYYREKLELLLQLAERVGDLGRVSAG